MSEYAQRLEDLITISGVKSFDDLANFQERELLALFIRHHMPREEKVDLFGALNSVQADIVSGFVADYLDPNGDGLKPVAEPREAPESLAQFWMSEYRDIFKRDFAAMLAKVAEDDNERRADRSMAEGV